MKRLLNKIDHDDIDKVVLVLTILAVIMAVFIPVVMVILFQDIFFYDREQWLLSRPVLSYIVVIGSFLVVPAAAVIYFISKKIWEKKHPIYGGLFVLGLMLFALPVSYLGMMHYYYMDDEGFTYSSVMTTEEVFFTWEEAEELIVHTSDGKSAASYEAIELVFAEGESFKLDMNDEISTYRQRIFQAVEENGGKIIR